MRSIIVDSILHEMGGNPDIFFLTADMGINLVEKIQEKYTDRFANVGIAEQNLISICAGLSNAGFIPFAYTISNFLIHRCFEQIRNDICLHNYPIVLVGTSTGFDNSTLGPTHHIVDEWGALKAFPGIDIYCPSSVAFSKSLVRKILKNKKPCYVRVPKGSNIFPDSEDDMYKIEGQAKDTILISYGNLLQNCLQVNKINPEISVLAINKLHPLDEKDLYDSLAEYKKIIVVEDHFPLTGLYGSLCEFIAKSNLKISIESLAPVDYQFEVGATPEYFWAKHGMDVSGILKKLKDN